MKLLKEKLWTDPITKAHASVRAQVEDQVHWQVFLQLEDPVRRQVDLQVYGQVFCSG